MLRTHIVLKGTKKNSIIFANFAIIQSMKKLDYGLKRFNKKFHIYFLTIIFLVVKKTSNFEVDYLKEGLYY